ncbi:helix-turn-helix domain-containing protein [Paenibacillus elgii]|uniref:helix-turn-helix domain-containing protein n=1 Tax=Paenibacillus elgii TaxID=189691 RepID=UPI00203B61CF|nr:helix-turn-helix transcriptional regulator [Paenibacillus elgii]MCM3271153.1 helix-turn-helix transcriptional regulator [Paenibacillus elgii]
MKDNQFILYCKLGEILKQHDISVLKLSEEINHRRTTIMELVHNMNMDNKKISSSLIAKLCGYFNITPNDLFEVRKVDSLEDEDSNE